MANLKAFLMLSLVYLVAGDKVIPGPVHPTDPHSIPPTNATTSMPPTTTPTPITKSPKTTTIPTTTTVKTTTTTKTTTSPTTTTAKTTTSPTTASTTTAATTTTTATTIKPTTAPPLSPGKWSANYTNTNRTCLVLEAAMKIVLPYKDGNATKKYEVNVPSSAKSEGICTATDSEKLALKFGEMNTVTFSFKKSDDKKKYDVNSILVTLNTTLPNTNVTQFILEHQTDEFSTPVSNSYKCMQEKMYNLTSVDKAINYLGEFHISHFQVQAFKNATNQKFDEALDCEGSETPDVVPIAVGCALAALVIIVLIAYLIGRRRSQARGYLSM